MNLRRTCRLSGLLIQHFRGLFVRNSVLMASDQTTNEVRNDGLNFQTCQSMKVPHEHKINALGTDINALHLCKAQNSVTSNSTSGNTPESGSDPSEKIDRIRQRFSRTLNMKTELHPSGNGFSYYMPGLKFDDFNSAGYPDLAKVSRMFEWSRFNQWELMGGFIETPTRAYITSTLEIRLSRAFYDLASVDFPVKVTMHIYDIGRSSFKGVQYLRAYDPSDPTKEGLVLVGRQVVFVYVRLDGPVKKPIPIEEEIRAHTTKMLNSLHHNPLAEFKNLVPLARVPSQAENVSLVYNGLKGNTQRKLSSLSMESSTRGNMNQDDLTLKTDEKLNMDNKVKSRDPFNLQLLAEAPPSAFSCTITSRAEDCDLFSHVTQSIYFAYFRDAEGRAAKILELPSTWRGIPADPSERLVSRAAIEHRRELLVWEPMKVTTWYDEEQSGVMHFIIKNSDDDIMCLAFIEFHSAADKIVSAKL